MTFPGKDLPPEVRRKAWQYATSQNFQDVVTNGMEPLTLYQVMGEYEKAIEAIQLTKELLGLDDSQLTAALPSNVRVNRPATASAVAGRLNELLGRIRAARLCVPVSQRSHCGLIAPPSQRGHDARWSSRKASL